MPVVTRSRLAGVTAVAAVLSATAFGVPTAQAGPNVWTQLSSGAGELKNIDEPGVARVGKNLHVVWQEESADNKANLKSRVVAANGVPGNGVKPVVSGWNAIVKNPDVVASGGKPVVVFAGLRDGWQGALKSATLADGVTWTENADALTANQYAYAGYGTAAADDAGTIVVGTNGSGSSVFVNKGVPPAAADIQNDQEGSAVDLALARDQKTGQVWSAWYNLTDPGDSINVRGIGAQQVYPTVGGRLKAPGSTTATGQSLMPDQRVALAARNAADGGVWAAYTVGYPTAQTIRIWKVGTTISRTIRVGGDVEYLSLSAAPGGRLWLSWYDANANVIRATRTDPAVTTFGAIRTLAAPARRGGDTRVWSVASDGALGPLDLVVTAKTGPGSGNNIQVWHQQIVAPLSVTVAPVAVTQRGGNVVISVRDAGAPVPGAIVNAFGRNYLANSKGQVALVVPRRQPVGLKRITASRSGYFPGFANLRVTP